MRAVHLGALARVDDVFRLTERIRKQAKCLTSVLMCPIRADHEND